MQIRRAFLAAVVAIFAASGQASAAVQIQFWHAMPKALGVQLDQIVAGFNESQSTYKVVPVFKGTYTETVTSAIFAIRTQTHPALVQVNEIATATMMAAKGAIIPVYKLMHDEGEPFDTARFLPAVSGYYADADGKLLSYPFNVSTPILYYNKTLFRAAGLDDKAPPKTWPEMEKAARRLRDAGTRCGFTAHWPSWINVENFLALHNLPLATQSNGLKGLDAELLLNNPTLVRHVAALAKWQKTKLFDYGGRGTKAEPKFLSGECGMLIGSSGLLADIRAQAKFAVGFGMMPYWPDVPGAPQNSIIGGASLWVLRGRPADEYRGVAKFLAYLSRPDVQLTWHRSTGYLPITRAAYEYEQKDGFYKTNPGSAVAIEQLMLHTPTENSKGIRLGSFILIRDVIENELEDILAGKKSAQAGLDAAVKRGNELLRQFERANQ
ncbi:MAG: sn-glycerol-3-phosphate ABC transporter substrate-binding protein UgpB [Xanthobacteraceae bacterium]